MYGTNGMMGTPDGLGVYNSYSGLGIDKPSSSTLLYVGAGVAALAIIGGVIYMKKRGKRAATPNRRRTRER